MGNNISETDTADSNKKIEAIIRAVAVKHGTALGRNDPILILHTLNELLIKELVEKQEDLIHQFRVDLEEAAEQWNKNLKTKSGEFMFKMDAQFFQRLESIHEKQIDCIGLTVSEVCTESYRKAALKYVKPLYRQLSFIKLLTYLNIFCSVVMVIVVVAWLKS